MQPDSVCHTWTVNLQGRLHTQICRHLWPALGCGGVQQGRHIHTAWMEILYAHPNV